MPLFALLIPFLLAQPGTGSAPEVDALVDSKRKPGRRAALPASSAGRRLRTNAGPRLSSAGQARSPRPARLAGDHAGGPVPMDVRVRSARACDPGNSGSLPFCSSSSAHQRYVEVAGALEGCNSLNHDLLRPAVPRALISVPTYRVYSAQRLSPAKLPLASHIDW